MNAWCITSRRGSAVGRLANDWQAPVSADGDRIRVRRLTGIRRGESFTEIVAAKRASTPARSRVGHQSLAGVVDPMVPARQFGHRDLDPAAPLEVVAGALFAGARVDGRLVSA